MSSSVFSLFYLNDATCRVYCCFSCFHPNSQPWVQSPNSCFSTNSEASKSYVKNSFHIITIFNCSPIKILPRIYAACNSVKYPFDAQIILFDGGFYFFQGPFVLPKKCLTICLFVLWPFWGFLLKAKWWRRQQQRFLVFLALKIYKNVKKRFIVLGHHFLLFLILPYSYTTSLCLPLKVFRSHSWVGPHNINGVPWFFGIFLQHVVYLAVLSFY